MTRRSRRTALAKVAHLAADSSDVLRIERGSGVTTFVRFDPDRNQLRALTDRRGTVGTPEVIPHWRAVALATEGEIDYVGRGYYEATKAAQDRVPADRPSK
jgi:hypothetical protein